MPAEEPALARAVAPCPDPQSDARDLCRSLIQADPTLPYADVRLAAANLGLLVTRPLFDSVHQEIAGTVRGPDLASLAPAATPPPAPALLEMRRETATMDFLVGYLMSHPVATYEEVLAAARAQGIVVLPVPFERARTLAGLPPRRPPPRRLSAWADVGASSNTREFLVEYVKAHPEASYRDVKAAGARAGHDLIPATFASARRQAGLTQRRTQAPAVRGPRPAAGSKTTRPAVTPDQIIADIVDLAERLELECAEMREALAGILAIVREGLGQSR